MDNKIETYGTLWRLVDTDQADHELKSIATLFLAAMHDWPSQSRHIADFVRELKEYFGEPVSPDRIESAKYYGGTAWPVEAGSSIAELIRISSNIYHESNFDKIVQHVLDYYGKEFFKTDFIARLRFKSTSEGGRKTPAKTGYRPQVKFDFEAMVTSGQQTFIGKEQVFPGEEVDAKIKLISPGYFAGCLSEGMRFEFREGVVVMGAGEIRYIVNEKLEK